MASSTNIVCIFFFFIILQSSLQTLARDSQFFSKVSRKPEEEQPVFNPNDDFYKNLEKDAKPIAKQPEKEEEQEPHFIPQTTHTGYGLYGHDASLDAPSTTTTTTPTSFDNNKYENQDNFNNKNENIDSQNGKSYVPELTGLSETSYTNNVGPGKRVVNNNNNDDDKNNYETFGQGKDEKNYVPELSGLSEFSNKNDVAPRKYYPENNYNNNNNNNMFESNQNEKTYVPEVTGLSETSYKNNVGPRRYFPENNYNRNNNNNNNNNNNDNMFGSNQNEKTAYVPELTGLSETSYENNVGSSKYVPENNYYNYNHNNNNNNNGLGKYYASTRYNGGVEKQGMSDTRYLENGKYFHDIDAEKNFYPTKDNDMSYNYNNYNHGQFYGNSENNHEEYNNNNNNNNNNNKYFNRSGMQNQFPEEFEFDDQP